MARKASLSKTDRSANGHDESAGESTSKTAKASSISKRKKRDSGHIPASSEDDERPKKRKDSGKKVPVAGDSDALTDLGELEQDLKESPKLKKGKGRAKKPKGEPSDEEEEISESPKKRKRIPKKQQTHLEYTVYPDRHWDSQKFIGAHVSIADGAHYAPHRALQLGGKAFGMFTKTQKAWNGPPLSEASLRLFPMRCGGKTETAPDEEGEVSQVQLADGRGFDMRKHIVPHGSYLTNLCNPDPEKRKKSYENLLDELKRAEDLGIGLFNIQYEQLWWCISLQLIQTCFSPGTSTGACTREQAIAHLADSINDAHKVTKSIVILLENMAGSNNVVGGKFEDLGAIIALVEDKDRIGVCYDTCHGFAQGYDMRTEETYNAAWDEFERLVGIKYIKAFHLNDSREGLGKHRDLHENIGAGHLGIFAFQLLMRDPRWDGLPFILETPMLSGSLRIDAPKPRGGNTAAGNSSAVKAEDVEVSLNDTEAAPQPNAQTSEPVETPLTLGGSTWRREIELLYELEKVPLGETNAKTDIIHAEIVAIVAAVKAKDEAAKAAKKAIKAALKEQNGGKAKKSKKGQGSEDELEAEADELQESEEEKPKPKRARKTDAPKRKKQVKKEDD